MRGRVAAPTWFARVILRLPAGIARCTPRAARCAFQSGAKMCMPARAGSGGRARVQAASAGQRQGGGGAAAQPAPRRRGKDTVGQFLSSARAGEAQQGVARQSPPPTGHSCCTPLSDRAARRCPNCSSRSSLAPLASRPSRVARPAPPPPLPRAHQVITVGLSRPVSSCSLDTSSAVAMMEASCSCASASNLEGSAV